MQNQFLLFEGFDANNTAGLWVTDGTAPGTHELTGINGANPGGLSPGYITVFGGKILFSGFNANGAVGLWVTDGTAVGTHELTGISGANLNGLFSTVNPDFTAFDGQVLFSGVNANGVKGLWMTNGTAAGTHEITGISGANLAGVNPSVMTVFGDEVLFFGSDESGSQGLWVTDGTSVGTHELIGISGSHLAVFNDQALFESKDANGNLNLWVTDGTAVGTHELTGISGANSGGLFSNVGNPDPDFTIYNGKVLFNGLNASGVFGLWVTDGTAVGTHEITGISGTYSNGLSPRNMTIVNNKVVFIGGDANGQFDLWVTDGTAAGTHQLTSGGLWPSIEGNANFASFNGQVFFNPTKDFGLWVTDGTSAGTHELTGISGAYPGFLNPLFLTAFTSGGTTTDQISPYIYDNTVFDQTSDTAPLVPWFYFFSIGATFLTAGDYSAASASYPGPGSPQSLGFIAPTTFDFGSPAFTSFSNLQAAYPFGTYTVTAVGNQINSTSSVSYQANYFTSAVPFVTNYSSLNGFNPANDFTVHYNSFAPDAHVTTGFTFLTIWNATTHQVVFQDDFQSSSSTTALIPANTLSPNTNYTFELDFSDRLVVGSTTQGFDMRTDGSFTTRSDHVDRPPTIVSADLIGTISKASTSRIGQTDSASGVIAFQDEDTSDRPTPSIVSKSIVAKDANGNVQTLDLTLTNALKEAFVVTAEGGNTNNGKVDWTFSLLNDALRNLPAGYSVALTSQLLIDDHKGGTVPATVTVNLVFDPFIPYTDLTPGQPTPTDVVAAALQYQHSLWDSDNCTGLVWAVTSAVSQPFGYPYSPNFTVDSQHVPDPPKGFFLPLPPNAPDKFGEWLTVETADWQAIVQPGDLVRIPGGANLPADTAGHSFIVTGKDALGNWLVIDNTDPTNHIRGDTGPIIITEHAFNPSGTFGGQVLSANIAYVSRLESGPSGSFTGPTVTGAPGHSLTYGNASAFLDASNLQNQTITAGNGDDIVTAGSHDTITLLNGNDQVTAGSGSIVKLGNGADTVLVGSNSVIVVGNGNDVVSVGENSTIKVGNGNDVVAAGAGSTITLGSGKDTVKAVASIINAGSGYDTFVFAGKFGHETITNFNLQKDIIELDHSDFANVATVLADMSNDGSNTVISDGHGNDITLVGRTIKELIMHQSDFHFI